MLTFASRALHSDEALYQALETKAAGAIRSAVSSCSHVAQSVLVEGDGRPNRSPPSGARSETSSKPGRKRSRRSSASPKYADLWEPYPFNAGYFMCVKLKGLDAETYRKHLLEKHGVGVIADGQSDIRIAFSSVDIGPVRRPLRRVGHRRPRVARRAGSGKDVVMRPCEPPLLPKRNDGAEREWSDPFLKVVVNAYPVFAPDETNP